MRKRFKSGWGFPPEREFGNVGNQHQPYEHYHQKGDSGPEERHNGLTEALAGYEEV